MRKATFTFKRAISFMLVLCMLFTYLPATAEAADIVAGGTCGANGDNLTWTLDSEGVLNICGSGKMGDYPQHVGAWNVDRPWEEYCADIKTVVIQEGVTSIGSSAFEWFDNISSITLPNSLQIIGEYSLSGIKALDQIFLPYGLNQINDHAFENCTHLEQIDIPDSVTTLGWAVFNGCNSLSEVSLPKNITAIQSNFFQNCSSLSNVTIPENVTSIGAFAFSGCTNLSSVTITGNATFSGMYVFSGCSKLAEFRVSETSETLCVVDGVLYSKDKTTLYCYPLAKAGDRYSILDSVIRISDSAFAGCSQLTSISIPNGITTIGTAAFAGCINVDEFKFLNIPQGVSRIGNDAFAGCNIVRVKIPEGVLDLPTGIFFRCNNLESIIVPKSIVSIGTNAFGGTGLTNNYYRGSKDEWSKINISSYGSQPVFSATIHYDWNDNSGEEENTPIPLGKYPMLDEENAKAYLGFIYNDGYYKDRDYSNRVYYHLFTGDYSDFQSEEALQEYILAFSAYLRQNLAYQIDNSTSLRDRYADLLVSHLQSKLNSSSEIDSEIISEYTSSAKKYLKDGIVELVKDWVHENTYIELDNAIEDINTAVSAYNTILSAPNKATEMVDNIMAAIHGAVYVLNSEITGRAMYFESYLNVRQNYSPDDVIFQTIMDYNFMAASENNFMGKFVDLLWFAGKDSWTNHRATLDSWTEFAFQLENSVTAHGSAPTYQHSYDTKWRSDDTYHWLECTLEGHSDTINKATHTWSDGVVITPVSYDSDGVKVFTCTICESKRMEVTPKLEHHFSTEWSKDETHHWHDCEDTDCSEVSNKDTHTWNDGEVTTAPTYMSNGVKTYTCITCGQIRTESINKLVQPTTYTVTMENGTGGGSYAEGASVTITANAPATGKQFKEWTGTDGLTFISGSATTATAAFTMPAQAVTLTATYEDIPATAPIVTTQPTNLELQYGYIADNTLTVVASAADGHTITGYQWYSCDDASRTNAQEISGATNASYTIPMGKSAGTTECYYCIITAARTDNSQTATSISDVATVTVSKAANPATVTGTVSVTRGGNSVDLSAKDALNGVAGAVSYEISGEANGCTLNGSVLTSGTNMGSVTVNVTIAEDANYEALAATPISVIITDKATQTISFSATQTKTYGDSDFTVTVTGAQTTVSYQVTSGDAATVDSATGAVHIVKAGTVTITATAAETDAYASATASYTLTVDPKSVTIPTAANGLKWTGSEQTGVAAGVGYTMTNGKATNVGNYIATATLTDTTNYKWSDNSTAAKSIPWSIGKANGHAVPAGIAGVAPTSSANNDGKITGVDTTMEYSANGTAYIPCYGTEITGFTAGTYYVRVAATTTHEAGASVTVSVPAYTPPTVYSVTVTNDGHGIGSAFPASDVSGTEVTLTASPASGYRFKEWQVVSGGVTVTNNKFTIGTANVTVKAVFEQITYSPNSRIT